MILLLILIASVLTNWWIFVPAAFLAFGSFMSINSYVADKHKINWLFIVLGIVFTVVAAIALVGLIGSNHQ